MSFLNFVEDLPTRAMMNFSTERRGRMMRILTRTWRMSRRVRIPMRYLLHPARKLPSFIGIGEQKCGTSSLFHYFSRNPELDRPMLKEVHFFGRASKTLKSEAIYRSYFPLNINDKPTFEVTPGYLTLPSAPREMHQMLPDIKLIVMVREPVTRFWSGYNMGVRSGKERRTPMEVVRDYPNPTTIGRHVERGEYAKNLSRWLDHYDRDQIMVVKCEDLGEWSWSTMSRIYQFLGVEWTPPPNRRWNVASYDRNVPADVKEALDEHYGPHNDRLKEEWDISW